MNAREIQQSLMFDRFKRNQVCPNYTPFDWWECDLFEITAAGYFREYEIKLSKSDFRADARKDKRFIDRKTYDWKKRNKHERLAMRDTNGPTRFWYVAPEGVIEIDELPWWAGLIIAAPCKGHRPPWSVSLLTVKEAPKLHGERVNPKVKQHMEGVFYYRFLNRFMFGRDGDLFEEPAKEPTLEQPNTREILGSSAEPFERVTERPVVEQPRKSTGVIRCY